MIKACAVCLVLFLLLPGAASGEGTSNDPVFNKQDPDGLILVGLRTDSSFRSARGSWLEFARYNPETTGLSDPASSGPKLEITEVEKDWKYFLLKVPPAHYVIRSVQSRQLVHCLDQGTLAFEVEPGKITYIGDIELKRSGISFSGMEVQRALKAALEHPGIKGELKPALDIKRTRFSAGGDAAGAKAACVGLHFR